MTDAIADRRAELRNTPERRRHTREPFVEFRDVYKAYGTKQVLCGADLKVYRGEKHPHQAQKPEGLALAR